METEKMEPIRTIGKYSLMKVIGTGGFAEVYLAINTKTKEKVAIKIIKRKITEDSFLIQYIENELRMITRFDHPNIVKVQDIIYTPEEILIIMEYLPNGDLQSFVDTKTRTGQTDQIRIATEILEGINYLHKRGIAHRDIKPANIMFDEKMHPKIIDFGFCREKSALLNTCCGTQPLMAPEIVMGKTYDGLKADIWSYGVTIHIMAMLALPFEFQGYSQFIHDVKNNSIKMCIKATGVIGWLVKNSLAYNAEERASCDDLLNYIKTKTVAVAPQLTVPIVKRANTYTVLQPTSRIISKSPVVIRSRKIANPLLVKPQTPAPRPDQKIAY